MKSVIKIFKIIATNYQSILNKKFSLILAPQNFIHKNKKIKIKEKISSRKY
jgi:hypothetical protein